jgi:hypothetical protein
LAWHVCFHVAGDRRASGECRIAVAGSVAVGTTETNFAAVPFFSYWH